jgi:hypothetical protein
MLGRSQSCGELVGAQLKQIGDEEKATRAGGGEPTFEQGGDVMFDIVPGDDTWPRLAGAVEDFDLFWSQESGRKGLRDQPFFLARL